MQNHSLALVLAVVAVVAASTEVLAQTSAQSGAARPMPDLSGVWSPAVDGGGPRYIQEDPPPLQPWAMEIYKRNRAGLGNPRDPGLKERDPATYCFPYGATRLMVGEPFELIQRPSQVILLFGVGNGVRYVQVDGREHPEGWPFGWMGNSIGKWDGNMLVVDTVGFNDRTWLDISGTPHSDALHVVERIRRVNQNTMEIGFLIEDSKAFTKQVTAKKTFQLQQGLDVLERITCEDYMKVEGNWRPNH